MNIEDLIRPNIKALKPYRAARHDFVSGVLLDANENSFGSAIDFNGIELNRYPDPYQKQLRLRLATLHGVELDNVFLGVGSDEVIDLLIRVFCEPALDSLMILDPTYGMYRVAAGINNVRVIPALLTDEFQIDVGAATSSFYPTTKMIFCCSPNNPTANLLRRTDVLTLCRNFPAIVVVDEAYIDFSEGESLGSMVNSVSNLVVLRTLSKAWGLAGIRLGYAVAHPLVISYLLKINPPYNINALTSLEAMRALNERERVRQTAAKIIDERIHLAEALASIPYVIRVFPSDTNFLLVRCRHASSVFEQLTRRGIIVRDRSSEPKLEDCLRITVGTRAQNDLLINTMKELKP